MDRSGLLGKQITGVVNPSTPPSPDAATGFLIGAGADMDYRAAALIHSSSGEGAGLFAGINGEGKLFFRDFTKENKFIAIQDTPGTRARISIIEWFTHSRQHNTF